MKNFNDYKLSGQIRRERAQAQLIANYIVALRDKGIDIKMETLMDVGEELVYYEQVDPEINEQVIKFVHESKSVRHEK